MVRGINVLRVLQNLGEQIARSNAQRSGDGVQSETALRPGRRDRSWVQVQRFLEVRAARTDVSNAREDVSGQLTFDGQVPVVIGGDLVFVGRVPAQIEAAKGKRRVLRRRKRSGEQICL